MGVLRLEKDDLRPLRASEGLHFPVGSRPGQIDSARLRQRQGDLVLGMTIFVRSRDNVHSVPAAVEKAVLGFVGNYG